ncbi:MAG: hypothetical protein CVV44_18805 [Spirochaetae bacterium HGW-Spirochaetae-1]|jgi:hypothetical protein|nr:MAG: hypothetical protein CVV44_18805 [Spirochaetae bacterium HGW-Spirochaetae-1]
MKYLIPIFILCLSTLGFSDEYSDFAKLCTDADMSFSIPDGFKPVKVKTNPDVIYQYAVRHATKKVEIRYSIFSLKEDVRVYEEYQKNKEKKSDTKIVLTDPNEGYILFAVAVVMNISQSEQTKGITEFKPADVKHDFNADWGASYFIENNSDYGHGYKYSLVVAIHKKNIANAFIVYLFDDGREIKNEMLTSFYNLKFK